MGRTILVIDDNPLVCDVVRRMLETRGYIVHTAEGGLQGLELLAQHDEIVGAIVDVDMPGMDGLEVCREIGAYAAGTGRDVWVWLMTGVTRPELEARAAAAGARGVLAKPFTTHELVRCCETEAQPVAVV